MEQQTTTNKPSAKEQVFAIPELMEQIMMQLPDIYSLFRARNVCTAWRNIADGSFKICRALWFEADPAVTRFPGLAISGGSGALDQQQSQRQSSALSVIRTPFVPTLQIKKADDRSVPTIIFFVEVRSLLEFQAGAVHPDSTLRRMLAWQPSANLQRPFKLELRAIWFYDQFEQEDHGPDHETQLVVDFTGSFESSNGSIAVHELMSKPFWSRAVEWATEKQETSTARWEGYVRKCKKLGPDDPWPEELLRKGIVGNRRKRF